MTSPFAVYGPLPGGRDGWEWALLRLATPAVERAALGPDRQPAVASASDPGATWWELVTRPMWGLAALGPDCELWPAVADNVHKAVDPEHEWYIGPPFDRTQRLVEAAAAGWALSRVPQHLASPELEAWLRVAAATEPVDNNWHFFPVLAGLPLGIDGSAHLARLDEFYIDDGWYQDGFTGRFDYYNPFGFHFYNALLGRHTDHLKAFARQFEYWFAATGEAIPFGRSMGYRMAQGAFWGALAYAGVEALPWGRVRGLAQRHLEWWWQQPILDGDGLLSVGYRYPNTAVVEQYMGGGSPYWGTKFFLPLALPPDHPFWTAEPEPVADGTSSQPSAKAVVQRHNGDVVLYNGQGWADWARGGEAKYARFAYSTRAGFSVSAGTHGLEQGAFDSTLALSDDGGRHWRAREAVEESRVDGDTVWARWRPWPDVTIETWLIPRGEWHLRVHRITTARELWTAEGGFAQPWTAPMPEGNASPGRAGFANAAIEDLSGGREGVLIRPLSGTNVLHPRTTIPTLTGSLQAGEHILTCAVYLGAAPGEGVAWAGVVPDLGLR